MARAAESAYREGRVPLNSAEGFVRQVIGWREYVYWQYWRLMPELAEGNHWNATLPLPRFFWDARTDLNCLRDAISGALQTGYSHHIERLMLLANFSVLAGLDPKAVTEWFQSVYVDAYDWVMQPNAMGMGLHADGGRMATKPYIASANYLRRMGDHCASCRFDPRSRTGDDACPFNYLYWNFALRNQRELGRNPRMATALLGLRRLASERSAIAERSERFLAELELSEPAAPPDSRA
jgi:deoxyribodipyrimidine photolyase-related protein